MTIDELKKEIDLQLISNGVYITSDANRVSPPIEDIVIPVCKKYGRGEKYKVIDYLVSNEKLTKLEGRLINDIITQGLL